jgi:hypothetical protein
MVKLLTLVWTSKGFVKFHNFNNGEDKSLCFKSSNALMLMISLDG